MARYRLLEVMDERGWSVFDLAQRAGVSTATRTKLRMGRGKAMPETLERLAAALGVKPEKPVEGTARR
jgi:DNA-binding Xre family transcriptional regulator